MSGADDVLAVGIRSRAASGAELRPGRAGRRRRRALAGLAAGLAALSLAGGVARADVSRVGVVVASRHLLSERDADLVASRLGAALRAQLEVDVIAGAEARRRLPPAGLPKDCVAHPDCLRDVANRLDGDEVLFLYMVRHGQRVDIDVAWSDPDIDLVTSRPPLVLPALVGAEADRVLRAAPSQLLPHASPRGATSAGRVAAALAVTPRSPARRRLTVPVIVTGAVAVAALGTGVGFAFAARADYNELENDDCAGGACPQAERRVDQMERRALVADILLGTAVVAAATSTVLYLTSRRRSESRLELGAAPAKGGGLVSLRGVF